MNEEERAEAVMVHLDAARALILLDPPSDFKCFWCGAGPMPRDEFREHSMVCPHHPAVARVAVLQAELAALRGTKP